ncbi:MAG: membrane protein insertase YidC [Bacteroidota bacterium]
MDRNSVIGLIMIAGILVVFSIYNAPSEDELKAAQAKRDSIEKAEKAKDTVRKITVEDTKVNDSLPDAILTQGDSSVSSADSSNLDSLRNVIAEQDNKNKFGIFSPSAKGESNYYTLENEKIKVTFNSKGGRIAFVELKDFKKYTDYAEGKETAYLKLFDEDSSAQSVSFFLDNRTLSTDKFFFTSASPVKQEVKDKALSVTFRLNSEKENKYIDFIYTLEPDTYVLNYDVVVNNLETENVASTLSLYWQMKLLSTEKTRDQEVTVSSVFFQYEGEGRDYLSEMESEKQNLEAKTQWIAFKQSYFSAVLMSDNGFEKDGSDIEVVTLNSTRYIKDYIANVNIAGANSKKVTVPMKFYFGPNDYHELAKFENGMEGIVNLGWGIFGWVNKYLVIPVFNFLEGFGMNYGLIILFLTIIVKLIILPLTYRNLKSSAKMRVLKPDVDEINKRLADEPMKKQQEVMALYRKSGVNPLAGCIPLLIQMPVLIAVFRFFPSAIELRQESFLWAEDLSAYDSIINLGFNIPFYGDHVSLFTLLMCVSTILITMMNSGQMDTSMPGMKFMMYFFPVMMLFFFNNYSSGLTYYYFISNLMSMGIMWGIKKYAIDEKKLLAQIHENRKKPVSAKKSAFMQRLEEAQKKQQQARNKKK